MDKLAWWMICIIILISPITMIGGTPPVHFLFNTLCLTTCLLAIPSNRSTTGENFILPLTLPFLAISIYFAFQVIPQSPAQLKLLAPDAWQAYQETIWRLKPGTWMPISTYAEGTLHAWLHIVSLWAFSIAFGFSVNSPLRLIKLIYIFVVAVFMWVAIIVFNWCAAQGFWGSALQTLAYGQNFNVSLGLWVVVFSPMFIAGYVACKAHSRHIHTKYSLKHFLKQPELPPQTVFVLGLFLTFIGLLFLFSPFLWISMLTGCLLFWSIMPRFKTRQKNIHMNIVYFVTYLFVAGLIVWSVFANEVSTISVSDTASSFEFSWVGHGLDTNSSSIKGQEELRGGGESNIGRGGAGELWQGLGLLGTILVIVAMIGLHRGGGSNRRINQTYTIVCCLYAGSLSGLAILLISAIFNSLWGWLPLSVCIIYLIMIEAWCERLSYMIKGHLRHEIPLWKARLLRAAVCLFLSVGVLFTFLKSAPEILATTAEDITSSDNYPPGEGRVVTWWGKLSSVMPYDVDLELFLGQRYLMQHRDQEAEMAILSAFEMRPLSPQVHIAVAGLYACAGDVDTAMYFLSTKTAKHYAPDDMTELLVVRLLELSEHDAAIKLINLTLEHSPQYAGLYLNLLMLYGYEALSLKSFLPQQPLVMLALGDLLLTQNYQAEAEDVYWQAVYSKGKSFFRDENIYLRVARYFSKTDRLNEAIIVLKEGRKAFPDSKVLKDRLSNLHI